MQKVAQPKKKHEWISNTEFTKLTGIKKVCMVCGQTNVSAEKYCNGPKTDAEGSAPNAEDAKLR